ncbi:lysosome membrane protein 2-like isoform X2 [Phymastichus coffea]|uniref:lysosome membrane protein 2-like isoform X2 n=1 Tax=Phymastichus coffea TaxID=108790 RepID=UPI00273C2E21|nr:lysosome membrane protein 2-like isoform X2 [Phymastichus coffea]
MEKAVERNLKIGISRNRPGFWLLSSLVVLSLSLCAVSWLTEVFSDAIVSRLQLRNGSLSFAWWQHPTVRAVYRIHVFNYTNVEDFEAGRAAKLHVHEIGPYVYRETVARIKPKIADNLHEISYQEMRSYQWEGGSPDDEQLTVPNVPLFTAIAFARDMSFIAQLSLTAVLSTIRSKPFLKLPVHSYLWGYDDELFRLAKPLISWQQNIPYDNFGILAFKAGVSKDRLTISSGLDDIRNLGNTIYFNGRSNRNIWHDQKCDKVEGSDGSMFPPSLIRDHTYNIKFYAKEMCRSIPLQYYGKSYAKGIPSLRYKLSGDVFTANSSHNSCYCHKRFNDTGGKNLICSPKGIFNTSVCNFGAPILSSLPHFYLADESLLDNIDGLKPKEKLHETYVDIHPMLWIIKTAVLSYSTQKLLGYD